MENRFHGVLRKRRYRKIDRGIKQMTREDNTIEIQAVFKQICFSVSNTDAKFNTVLKTQMGNFVVEVP